jgi:enoyl-[acyl-carrier protein] reductase I
MTMAAMRRLIYGLASTTSPSKFQLETIDGQPVLRDNCTARRRRQPKWNGGHWVAVRLAVCHPLRRIVGMNLLAGKTGIIYGVANKYSIAWAIAQAAAAEGARLALTYQNERLEKNVRDLAATLDTPLVLPCDVTNDEQIEAVYRELADEFGHLDFIVHSVAFAKAEDLDGRFLETSRDGFRLALEISAYSLVAVTRPALPLMKDGGSVITMTYLGSERATPHYNVMGVAKAALESSVRYLAADLGPEQVRVNAVSAGPVNTLAARGVKGFVQLRGQFRERNPLHRDVDAKDVANAALFLLSDLSRSITGEVLFVDCGYNMMGW